ncbi:WD40 repeat domain-containing serine/threonine protein kinase [Limnoglobus roseus]|uniref:non-specific serine/threonine protein kinase n=1 Tax=Limnoglobus roseus TaxID=2598579 RepID=A0A5C1AHQ3_9BACT|nr:serine/threonine-protein kinase [Limnoglobus roseus]QEL17182.1 serine/threonine protein kinase [Limnoglobus roseus]
MATADMTTDATPQVDCPSAEELRRLARGHLTDARQAVLTAHLDRCPGCQGRLDEIAADGDKLFTGCMKKLCEPPAPKDSAFWDAMSEVEAEVTGTTPSDMAGNTSANLSDLKLDFLQPTDTPGRIGRLGAFDVIRVVGRGGMGVVLAAFDESLQREVAIKVLDPQLKSNDTAQHRFCREARAAAKVSHDNIVTVYQVSEEEAAGLPYLVMQLVNGETLEDRLRRIGKLSIEEAVRVAMQAALGLAAAHEHLLIHRDIKPANILIDAATNKVKLTDFGLARAAEDLKLTRTGFVAGTPLYMAPEQARGDGVDPRSDLFSLGSVMYESLAGKPPFEGKTPLVVLRRLTDETHEPLHKLNPEVPDWLEDVIDKLLEKNPDHRYQTATELANELTVHYACLKPATMDKVEACPMTQVRSWRSLVRSRSQRKFVSLLAGTFLLGSVAGATGMYFLRPRGGASSEVALAVPDLGPAELNQTDNLKAGAVWSLSPSPDGKFVAAGMEDGTIKLWNLNGGGVSDLGKHDGSVWSVNFTPDGNRVVSASGDGTVQVWNVTSMMMEKGINNRIPVRSAAMNADQTSIVTGDATGMVKIWDIESMGPLLPGGVPDKPRQEFVHRGTISAVAFSPDGTMVASGSANKTAILWDVKTGKAVQRLIGHEGPIYSLAFSPEGDRLATVSWDHSIRIWDTKNGDLVKKIENAHEEGVWSVSYSCCGKILASAGQEGLVKVWDIDNTEKPIRVYSRHKGTVHAVHFTAKGTQLITGGRDGTIRLWKVRD